MNNNYKQSQFELFPGSANYAQDGEKQRSLSPALTLSLDKILMMSIAIVMVMVLSFSLGIERGKKLFAQSINAPIGMNRQAKTATGDKQQAPSRLNERSAQTETLKGQTPVPVLEKLESMGSVELGKTGAPNETVYTVQVASFKREKYAKEEAMILSKKNNDHEIFVLPKGSYSIVCVGKFAKKQEAKSFSSRLKKKYKDCLVRRL